jgi:hypothetical protein
MPTILPEEHAVVVSRNAIVRALGLSGADAVEARDVAGAYRSVRDRDAFILCFTGAVPASVEVDVTSVGGTAKTTHVLTLGGADSAGAVPAGRVRRVDPMRPFILAIAGIIASSVALLVAAFAGVSGKDAGGAYQDVLAEVMMWMAAVVVLATVAALLLQVIRVVWMWARDGASPRALTLGRAVGLALCLIVCAVPVCYGWFAAQAAVRGGVSALKWQPDRVPWPLRMFD